MYCGPSLGMLFFISCIVWRFEGVTGTPTIYNYKMGEHKYTPLNSQGGYFLRLIKIPEILKNGATFF